MRAWEWGAGEVGGGNNKGRSWCILYQAWGEREVGGNNNNTGRGVSCTGYAVYMYMAVYMTGIFALLGGGLFVN